MGQRGGKDAGRGQAERESENAHGSQWNLCFVSELQKELSYNKEISPFLYGRSVYCAPHFSHNV